MILRPSLWALARGIAAIVNLKPLNIVSPSIVGTPRIGETVTGTTGTWAFRPTSFAYRYIIDGVPSNVEIQEFAALAGMAGKLLQLRVSATNDNGTTVAFSAPILIEAAVALPDGIPNAFTIAPVVDADPLATYAQPIVLEGFDAPVTVTGTGGAIFSLNGAPGSFVTSLVVPAPRTIFVAAAASIDGDAIVDRTVNAGGVSAVFRIITKAVESSGGSNSPNILAISPKIVAHFDASDPSTMYQDVEMTMLVVPNGTLNERKVAAHAPKTPAHPTGDKALARLQPISAKRPVYSPTGYGYGGVVPGLIYADGAWMKSPRPPADIGPAGIPSMAIAFQRTDGGKIFSVYGQAQDYGESDFNIGTFDNGGGGWGWGGSYAGTDCGHDFGSPDQPVNDYPTRMYIEHGNDTSKVFFGKPDVAPKLVSTANGIVPRSNFYFGTGKRGLGNDDANYGGFPYFANFLGNDTLTGNEQHWVWLSSAPTDAERTALDAAFKATEGVLVPLTPTMKKHVTTGSVAKGSKVWTVASTAGMAPNDHLIMQANTAYRTIGPGGCIPALSAATEAEIAAMTTSVPEQHIYARDTLRVFKAHPKEEGVDAEGKTIFSTTEGVGYYAWDAGVFYTQYTQPLALRAVIETVDSPTQITVSVAAVEACTNTEIVSDNHALLQALNGPQGTFIDLGANNEGEFYLGDTWHIAGKKGWTISGGQTDKVTLRAARGETGALISIFQCSNMEVKDLTLRAQRANLTYNRGKLDGNFNGPGVALEFGNSVDCKDTNVHVIEPQHSAIVHRNVYYGTGSGSKNAKVTVYTAMQQYLAHWAWNAVNCYTTLTLDGYTFESPYIEAALEAFQSDGIRLLGVHLRNGRMALNTSKNCEVEGSIVIEPMTRAVHTFSPYHIGTPLLDVNNNVGGTQGQGELGGGGRVRLDIDIQGWMDAQGNVPRAIASGSDQMLFDGTHITNVADDGLRHGSIRAPYPKVGHDGYSAPCAQLAVGAPNTVVRGYKFESFSLPGSIVPTEYDIELLAYTMSGTVFTDNITGHAVQSISTVPEMARNVSGAEYASRGA